MHARLGVNVDPARGDCRAAEIAATGAGWVRLVLRLAPDLRPWLGEARTRGLRVLGVLARESVQDFGGWVSAAADLDGRYGALLDALQVGNEPDQVGPSSWTLSQREYLALLSSAKEGFAARLSRLPIVGAGLASGQPSWLEAVRPCPTDALAVHPYGESAATLPAFVERYRRFGCPIWITEGWQDAAWLRAALVASPVVFAWWHDPIGDGALGMQGRPERLAAFKALAREQTQEVPTVATLDDAQRAAYQLADPSIPYANTLAIARKWKALKAEGTFIGAPIGPEMRIGDTDGQPRAAQAFTSGAILVWRGGDVVTVE